MAVLLIVEKKAVLLSAARRNGRTRAAVFFCQHVRRRSSYEKRSYSCSCVLSVGLVELGYIVDTNLIREAVVFA